MVHNEIPDETNTIRGIPVPLAGSIKPQGIYSAGALSPSGQDRGQLPCCFLERYGNIKSLAAQALKVSERRRKTSQIDEDGLIDNGFSGLPGKGGVDLRRLAVRDGVAHHTIIISTGNQFKTGHPVLIPENQG